MAPYHNNDPGTNAIIMLLMGIIYLMSWDFYQDRGSGTEAILMVGAFIALIVMILLTLLSLSPGSGVDRDG